MCRSGDIDCRDVLYFQKLSSKCLFSEIMTWLFRIIHRTSCEQFHVRTIFCTYHCADRCIHLPRTRCLLCITIEPSGFLVRPSLLCLHWFHSLRLAQTGNSQCGSVSSSLAVQYSSSWVVVCPVPDLLCSFLSLILRCQSVSGQDSADRPGICSGSLASPETLQLMTAQEVGLFTRETTAQGPLYQLLAVCLTNHH